MEMEAMTEGIAVGAALVSYTALSADGCDCIGVCDWTHSAVFVPVETQLCQLDGDTEKQLF